MSKLYVGNLPTDITEKTLRQLFLEHNLLCRTILIKRGGYAFVDCLDQSTADLAIDTFNGRMYFGSKIQVEPSIGQNTKKQSSIQESVEQPVSTCPSVS